MSFKKFKSWVMAPSGFNSRRREPEEPGEDIGMGIPKFWPDDMLGLKKKRR